MSQASIHFAPKPRSVSLRRRAQSLLLPVLCALAAYRLVELDVLPDWLREAQVTNRTMVRW